MLITVEGVVTNTKTGAPIADAVIQLAHYYGQRDFSILAEVSSSQEGRFDLTYEFHQCKTGAFIVLANAYGYKRFDVVNDSYLLRCTSDIQTANFQLDPL
jgi:5-hydroxyisourate hydrolase-like protein (transthyretin family)